MKDILMFVHGLNDHGARFEPHVERFAELGIGVVALDLHGHGRSAGTRGMCAPLQSNVQDVTLLAQAVSAVFKRPLHLVGASFGGVVALKATETLMRAKSPHIKASAVTVCSSHSTRVQTLLHQKILYECNALPLETQTDLLGSAGKRCQVASPVSSLVLQAPLVQLSGMLYPPLLKRAWARTATMFDPSIQVSARVLGQAYHPAISRQRVDEDLQDMMYFRGPVTAQTGTVILDMLTDMGRVPCQDVAWPPILLQHGEQDKVCDIQGTRRLQQTLIWEKASCVGVWYKDGHHDLLRDTNDIQGRTVADIINFMNEVT